MKQNIRTFVAVKTDSDVRDRVVELIEQFRATGADVRWVQRDNLHVTLKFLGDVDLREMNEVCQAVQGAVADLGRFEYELHGSGAFPNADKPRTIWLGVRDGSQQLALLNERIELAVAKLGFHREARRYEPHLTIGRIRRGKIGVAELGNLIRQNAELELGRTLVSEVVVFSSQLDRSGPSYEALSRAPLARP